MDWPADYPENCPPEDAEPASGTVYMLTHSPFEPRDFLSLKARMPNKSFNKPMLECRARGLSVLRDRHDAERLRKRVTRLQSFNGLAVANPTADQGLMKSTPSSLAGDSHHTWWVPPDVNRQAMFSIVYEWGKE